MIKSTKVACVGMVVEIVTATVKFPALALHQMSGDSLAVVALLNALVFQFNISGAKTFSHRPSHRFHLKPECPCLSVSLDITCNTYRDVSGYIQAGILYLILKSVNSKGLNFYGVRHLHSRAAQPLQGRSISLSEIILRVACELDGHSASIVAMFDLCPHILLF